MTDKLESELDQLLDKYDANARAREKKQEQQKATEDAFERDFAALRRDVVRPVLEALGSRLKARGHHVEITETEARVDPEGRPQDARIQIRIFPSGVAAPRRSSTEYPSLSLIAVRYKKTIMVHGSNMTPLSGGSAGSRGEYALKGVTKELVTREFLAILSEVVDK